LGDSMRYAALVLASLLLAPTAYGQEPKAYQSGQLLRVDAVSCGLHNKQELWCQEYVLQTDSVDYRIRPKHAKHPVLLPVGKQVEFRVDKNKMLMRVDYPDNKEHAYVVMSTAPHTESAIDASRVRLNHLQ
jgi:hypothetical protein